MKIIINTHSDNDPIVIASVIAAAYGPGFFDSVTSALAVPADMSPPPPLPAAPPSTPEPRWNTKELDADLLPWDERVHASTKTKTQKGHWTKKKGVADDLYSSVVTEMRGWFPAPAVAAPPAAAVAPPAPAPATPPPPPTSTPPPPPAPARVLSPDGLWEWLDGAWISTTAPSKVPEITWQDMASAMNRAVQSGRIDMTGINGIANRHGAVNFALLAGNADQNVWRAVLAELQPYSA